MSEELLFTDDGSDPGGAVIDGVRPWKILISDDDPAVHTITALVLKNFTFAGRPAVCFHAYNSLDTRLILEENPDTAVILLDVVMEHETSGLEIVRVIRDEMKNTAIRIILRTGQPGQAPETKVIREYDINDYRLKTDLTSQRLQTTLIAALRSYETIADLDSRNRRLVSIINNWDRLYRAHDLQVFMEGAFDLLANIMSQPGKDPGVLLINVDGDGTPDLLHSFGSLDLLNTLVAELPEILPELVKDAMRFKLSSFELDRCFFTASTPQETYLLVCVFFRKVSREELDMLELFDLHYRISLDSFFLRHRLEGSNEYEGVLGDVAHTASRESKRHILRVSFLVRFIAEKAGFSYEQAELLRLASLFHDIGNFLLPKDVLAEDFRYTEEERKTMQEHTSIGYELLKGADKGMFALAARIAKEHHERWDGTGYPDGLSKEAISLEARITALADVYDALSHDKPYRKALPEPEILRYLEEQAGKSFDPQLVKIFLDNYSDIKAMLDVYR